jgi:hypothetical protein
LKRKRGFRARNAYSGINLFNHPTLRKIEIVENNLKERVQSSFYTQFLARTTGALVPGNYII